MVEVAGNDFVASPPWHPEEETRIGGILSWYTLFANVRNQESLAYKS